MENKKGYGWKWEEERVTVNMHAPSFMLSSGSIFWQQMPYLASIMRVDNTDTQCS